MRTILLPWSFALALVANATTTYHELLVHFDKDRSELTAAAAAEIDAFLKACPLSGDFHFTVHGHTDSDGTADYNQGLSLARAASVQRYLSERGVDAVFMSIAHSGELDPVTSDRDEPGMAMNRRVRITFESHYYANVHELQDALTAGSTSQFVIDPSQANTITGPNGAQLSFKPDAFVDASGRAPQGTVTVELTEALGHQSMLAHQLSTRSGERMLETGGMLKVVATDEQGNDLQLAASAPMEVMLPTLAAQSGMELFVSNDGSDWSATSRTIQSTVVEGWVEPATPYVRQRAFKRPYYKEDKTGKPVKPCPPFLRGAPEPPRRESYAPQRSFFSFLWRRKAQAGAQARYELALHTYQNKLLIYERQRADFEREVATYPERLLRYEERKAVWEEQKKAEYAMWVDQVYTPAYEQHYQNNADRRALRDSLMGVWQQQRDSSFTAYLDRFDRTGTGSLGSISSYLFSTTALGWINCDRFIGVPQEQQYNVIAKGDAPEETIAYLVFTDMFSVLQMRRQDRGTWMSPTISRNEPVVLFAYTVKDGKPQVYSERVTAGERPQIEFRPSSFAEIMQLLREFGSRPT